MIFTTTICCSSGGSGSSGGTDLSTLSYADNDFDAQSKGIALKAFYLASATNTLGVKYGTVLRREY